MVTIDQLAQALARESGVSDWRHVSEHGDYDSRDYWRRLARSALVAMRDDDAMPRLWYAMIDAALSGAGDPR
jgi:hypothetical protein